MQDSTTTPFLGQRPQQAVAAELSGAGTWTVSGAEAPCDTSAADTSRFSTHGSSQNNSRAQHHVTHLSHISRSDSASAKYLLTSPVDTKLRRDSLLHTSIPRVRSHRNSISGPLLSNDSEVNLRDERYEPYTESTTYSRPVVEEQDDSTVAGAEQSQDTDDDDDKASSVHTPIEFNNSVYEEPLDSKRPYTNSLSLPGQIRTGVSPALSIISDAGHQQQLRQKQTVISRHGQDSLELSHEDASDHSSTCSSISNLQGQIFHALVSTRKRDAHIPDYGFLPQEQIYRVVNTVSVAIQLAKDLLQTHTSEEIARYAKTVCKEPEVFRKGKMRLKSFQKIFAILVMVEMSSSISQFLDEDVSDLDLPLVPIRKHGVIEIRRRDPSGNPSPSPLRCFRSWSLSKLRNFEQDQWIMLAPFFSQGEHGEVKHYILQDQHILPFVAAPQADDDDDTEFYGGFAKVMMVRIHPDHHNFRDKMLCDRGFAIKQLYENDRESFMREVNILKKFSGARGCKHIVSLLATYEHRGKFHFIFYRAGGDLFKYWKELKPRPIFHYANVRWMAEQCAGIADGLTKLHKHLTFTMRYTGVGEPAIQKPVGDRRVKIVDPIFHARSDSFQSNGVRVRPSSPTLWKGQSQNSSPSHSKPREVPHNAELVQEERFGRHGDINPGNILWYNDSSVGSETLSGTVKIADFGQAELNSAHSRTRPRNVANTMTYRPPECDVLPNIVRQSYDIWCLGCVYLEFVTWLLGGEPLLTRFGERRKARDRYLNNDITDIFYEFVRNQDTAETEVRIKPAVIKFIEELHRHRNCTEYLHELLVMIQHDMLIVDSNDRKPCEQVKQSLEDMYKRCCVDPDYASTPRPWCNGNKLTSEPQPRSVKVVMTEEAEQKIAENLPSIYASSRSQKKRTALNEQHRGFSAPEF